MRIPEVMSFREFRAGLASTLKRVQHEGGPVFVGAHRKPEAVVMSVAQYEELTEAAESALEAGARREAMADALASVRLEGLEPSAEGLALLHAVAEGELSSDAARQQILARYRQP